MFISTFEVSDRSSTYRLAYKLISIYATSSQQVKQTSQQQSNNSPKRKSLIFHSLMYLLYFHSENVIIIIKIFLNKSVPWHPTITFTISFYKPVEMASHGIWEKDKYCTKMWKRQAKTMNVISTVKSLMLLLWCMVMKIFWQEKTRKLISRILIKSNEKTKDPVKNILMLISVYIFDLSRCTWNAPWNPVFSQHVVGAFQISVDQYKKKSWDVEIKCRWCNETSRYKFRGSALRGDKLWCLCLFGNILAKVSRVGIWDVQYQ